VTKSVSNSKRKVTVIGAGWAGCAAAVELAKNGWQVSLLESSRTLGGRARKVEINGHTLDNGQHILLGAYRDSLRMMKQVGVDLDAAFLRLPLQMCYPNSDDPSIAGMTFIAPHLTAPLHLLVALWRAQGLNKDDKLALARFSTTARWMGWQLHQDCSVAELLTRFDQTQRLCDLMWIPLCIAALNTPPQRASAQVFLNVLRDSLGAKRSASDMLLPRQDLSTIFPEKAAQFVQRSGGAIQLGATANQIDASSDGNWNLHFTTQGVARIEQTNAIVLATPAAQTQKLLSALAANTNVDQDKTSDDEIIPNFTDEAITTCYLQYDPSVRLERVFFALRDLPARAHWGQFVFDRGQLHSAQAGLLAVVVSASGNAIEQGSAELANAIAAQLSQVFNDARLAAPLWHQIISEKRATFSCAPSLKRPKNKTPYQGLVIAGDYTQSDYPATLESAVRSGIQAAATLQKSIK
jgi:hydroxysqualene dehydroxylase